MVGIRRASGSPETRNVEPRGESAAQAQPPESRDMFDAIKQGAKRGAMTGATAGAVLAPFGGTVLTPVVGGAAGGVLGVTLSLLGEGTRRAIRAIRSRSVPARIETKPIARPATPPTEPKRPREETEPLNHAIDDGDFGVGETETPPQRFASQARDPSTEPRPAIRQRREEPRDAAVQTTKTKTKARGQGAQKEALDLALEQLPQGKPKRKRRY